MGISKKRYRVISLFTLLCYIVTFLPIVEVSQSLAASIPTTNSVLLVSPYNQESSKTGFTFDGVSGALLSGPSRYTIGGTIYYIYYTSSPVSFAYHGGTVKLSTSPSSFFQYKVDNGLIINVTRPDGSSVSYNSLSGWVDDVTTLFQSGNNTVTVSLIDVVNFPADNISYYAGNYRGTCGDWDIYSPGTYGKICNSLYLLENYTVIGSTAEMTSANGCTPIAGYPVCVDSGCKTFQASQPRTVCKDCWKWDKRYGCSGTNYQAGDNTCLQGILTSSKTNIANAYSGCTTVSKCVELQPAATYSYGQDVTCGVNSPVTLNNTCTATKNISLNVNQVTCQKNLNISINITSTPIFPGYKSPTLVCYSDPNHPFTLSLQGYQTTSITNSISLNYAGGTAVITPGPGQTDVTADDFLVINITRPDGTTVNAVTLGPNGGSLVSVPSLDITSLLQQGINIINTYGSESYGGVCGIGAINISFPSYTESWSDGCSAYPSDPTYKLVSGPTCTDSGTKNIGGYLFTRACWTYSSTYDHIQSQTQTITGCEAYQTRNDCMMTSETCTDSANPKTIQGFQITQPCWQWARTYDCADTSNMTNECAVYESDPNCSLKSSTCTSSLPSGLCQTYNKVFTCQKTITHAETCLRYADVLDCAGEMYCQNPNGCFDTTKPASKDFGRTASMLETLDQIAKDFQTLNVFRGNGEQCMSWDITGKNCCDIGAGVLQAAAAAYGTQAIVMSGTNYTLVAATSTPAVSYSIVGVDSFFAGGYGGGWAQMGYYGGYAAAVVAAYIVYQNLTTCNQNQITTSMKIKMGNCEYIGEFCDNSTVFGLCLSKQKSHCCFESKLSQLIWRDGGAQIGKSRGSASNPDCSGFTVEQLQMIEFSKIDFTPFYAGVKVRQPNMTSAEDRIRATIQSSMSNNTQPPP